MTATPNAVKAAFTKESDVFKENGIQYLDPILNIHDPKMFGLQMFQTWAPILGVSEEENERACRGGLQGFRRLRPWPETACPRSAGHPGTREPPGHRDAGPRLSSRSWIEPRDHGGVPEARLPGVLAELPARRTKTCSTGSSARRYARERSPTRSTFGTYGRTRIRPAPTRRSGRRSLPRGIRTWWRWRSATSSAGTMLRFIP